MAVTDIDIGVGPTLASRSQARIGAGVLFVLLCCFTLTTFDGGDILPKVISALLLLFSSIYFLVPPGVVKFKLGIPSYCLLGMTAWGILQTLFSPFKIAANGWNGVLFWFAVATIVLVGGSVFYRPETAAGFRLAFVHFGSGIAVLDLLQQATRAERFYWWIPSRYYLVFGPFAYWNHFAEFIELSLPVTLWVALSQTRPKLLYLLLSTAQLCAVVNSGSHVGTALVVLEVLVVSVLALVRFGNRTVFVTALAGVVLVITFAVASGYGRVLEKLSENDQTAGRRAINKSSIAMLAEHPFVGWGLDTYAPVYKRFALYDDGVNVSRAKNDWLQLAVEGGLPFAALLAVVFIWSVPPALQSGWGIGLIALGLHAIFDYPFARLGVCGWYFALVSMMSYQRAFQQLERDKPARESIY